MITPSPQNDTTNMNSMPNVFDFTKQTFSNASDGVKSAIARKQVSESHNRVRNMTAQTYESNTPAPTQPTWRPEAPESSPAGWVTGIGSALGGGYMGYRVVKNLIDKSNMSPQEKEAAKKAVEKRRAAYDAEKAAKKKAGRNWLGGAGTGRARDWRPWPQQQPVNTASDTVSRQADYEARITAQEAQVAANEKGLPDVDLKPTPVQRPIDDLPLEVQRTINREVRERIIAYRRATNQKEAPGTIEKLREQITNKYLKAFELDPNSMHKTIVMEHNRMTPHEFADFIVRKKWGSAAVNNPKDPKEYFKIMQDLVAQIEGRRAEVAKSKNAAGERAKLGVEMSDWLDAQDYLLESEEVVKKRTLGREGLASEKTVGINKEAPKWRVGAGGQTEYLLESIKPGDPPEWARFEDLHITDKRNMIKGKYGDFPEYTARAHKDLNRIWADMNASFSDSKLPEQRIMLENIGYEGKVNSNAAAVEAWEAEHKKLKKQMRTAEANYKNRTGKDLRMGTIRMGTMGGGMSDADIAMVKDFFGVKTNAEALSKIRAGVNANPAAGIGGFLVTLGGLQQRMEDTGAKWSDIASSEAWGNENLGSFLGEEAAHVGNALIGGTENYNLDNLIGLGDLGTLRNLPGEIYSGLGDIANLALKPLGMGRAGMKPYDKRTDPAGMGPEFYDKLQADREAMKKGYKWNTK